MKKILLWIMLSAVLPVKAQRKSYVQLKAAYEGGFINYTCESAGMEVCAIEDDFSKEVRQKKKELSDL